MSTQTSFLTSRRRNWRYALVAVLVPTGLIVALAHDTRFAARRPPPIIYAESWPDARTREDTVRSQRLRETARQAEGAKFEIERGQALLLRADSPATRAYAERHIADNRAALARWMRAHAEAEADSAMHAPPSPATPTH